tara:strand:- start:338 stop:601 length:264 start_codon:yes stop_codon:yes gene_type:complete
MYRNLFPPFIGVFSSFIALWQLHKFILVDNCLDHGGSYQYATAECLIENSNFLAFNLTVPLVIFYFFVGLIISLVVAFLVSKLFKIK